MVTLMSSFSSLLGGNWEKPDNHKVVKGKWSWSLSSLHQDGSSGLSWRRGSAAGPCCPDAEWLLSGCSASQASSSPLLVEAASL